MHPDGYHSGVNSASDNHRRHSEQHGTERGWKNPGLEDFCAADELIATRLICDQILYMLSRPDEIKHRHTLGESHKEGREEAPHDVLGYSLICVHRETHHDRCSE